MDQDFYLVDPPVFTVDQDRATREPVQVPADQSADLSTSSRVAPTSGPPISSSCTVVVVKGHILELADRWKVVLVMAVTVDRETFINERLQLRLRHELLLLPPSTVTTTSKRK